MTQERPSRPTNRPLWARVPPQLAWKYPGVPTAWVRVLERDDKVMRSDPLPGYVWLDTAPKAQHIRASWLEFRDDPP